MLSKNIRGFYATSEYGMSPQEWERTLAMIREANRHGVTCPICGCIDNAWDNRAGLCVECYCSVLNALCYNNLPYRMSVANAQELIRNTEWGKGSSINYRQVLCIPDGVDVKTPEAMAARRKDYDTWRKRHGLKSLHAIRRSGRNQHKR